MGGESAPSPRPSLQTLGSAPTGTARSLLPWLSWRSASAAGVRRGRELSPGFSQDVTRMLPGYYLDVTPLYNLQAHH